MKMIARACAMALCLALALSPAMAENVRFTLRTTVVAAHWPQELQPLAESLSPLAELLSAEGTLATNGDSFALDAAVSVGEEDFALSVWGVPSHWGVSSSLWGDAPLMLNHLALLEFGLKTEDHLGLPLQKAGLLIPYAHTSAWAEMSETLAPLLPETDGEQTLSAADAAALFSQLADMAELNRTVRCYMESLGVDMSLWAQSLTALCADGLTVRREGPQLTWTTQGRPLLTWTAEDGSIALTAAMDVLNLELHTSSEPTGDFSFALHAEGDALSERLHVQASGTLTDELFTLSILDEQARPAVTFTAELAAYEPAQQPDFAPEDIEGTNLFSLNGDSLSVLAAQIGRPLIANGLRLVSACPAVTVQTMMDALDESGVILLLMDALLHAPTEY